MPNLIRLFLSFWKLVFRMNFTDDHQYACCSAAWKTLTNDGWFERPTMIMSINVKDACYSRTTTGFSRICINIKAFLHEQNQFNVVRLKWILFANPDSVPDGTFSTIERIKFHRIFVLNTNFFKISTKFLH